VSPLLAVIDMQRFFAPGQAWAVPGFDELIEPIDRLVRGYRDRVVFTRFVVPETPSGSWVAYYERWPEVVGPDKRALAELVEPWAARDAPTVDKPTFSAWGPRLASLVGEDGELVLCGVSTNCCVLATALAAVDAGVTVRVAADACAGDDAAMHERALAVLAGFAPQLVISSVEAELAARG
jgi:nicotinamidase-related amidase